MSQFADTMAALRSFQEALNTGMPVLKLDSQYVERQDNIPGGIRYSYAKVVNGEAQALATFGPDEPLEGMECFSVNYVVSEKHRGRRLSIETVNLGLEYLKTRLRSTKLQRFYLEAIVEIANTPSIKVAEKIFASAGQKIIEKYSNKPALQFKRMIELR